MRQLRATIECRWYSTHVIIGGWAIARFYGPFHRYRANRAVEECRLKAASILLKERVIDTRNVVIMEN